MSLPNPSMSFSPFAILTAEEMNNLVENIEALAAGTGIAAGAITFAQTTGMGWELLGRQALSVAGDTLTLSSIPARKYLFLELHVIASGNLGCVMRFNNDSAANYSNRRSLNGAADGTSVSQTSLDLMNQTSTTRFQSMHIINVAAQEKIITGMVVEANTAGAGNAPAKAEMTGKWANTSAQITRVDVVNTNTGDMAIGTELVVWGRN